MKLSIPYLDPLRPSPLLFLPPNGYKAGCSSQQDVDRKRIKEERTASAALTIPELIPHILQSSSSDKRQQRATSYTRRLSEACSGLSELTRLTLV